MNDSQAVSLIPAAYYADLCCERGRYYLNEFFGDPSWAGSDATGTRLSREAAAQRVYERARQAWGQGVSSPLLYISFPFVCFTATTLTAFFTRFTPI